MNLLTVLLLAVALAMDCFAVSISQATCVKQPMWGKWTVMALLFGLFQGVMPLIGFFVMRLFADFITTYDHWFAFVVLGFLGARMIKEDLTADDDEEAACQEVCPKHPYQLGRLLILSVATSIDALATGVVFVPEPNWLVVGVIGIGMVSFLASLVGSVIGNKLGNRLNFKWGVIGGVILIAIGTKILIEHCYFS